MSNFSDDGTVLPFGLLSSSDRSAMEGFNKTYKNTALRIGVVTQLFITSDPGNKNGFANEYNVACIEQLDDRGTTTINYRNCIASSALGSIADFLEFTIRPRTQKFYKGDVDRLQDQNGSVVLILCLDGVSEKGIIIGGFPHPDRPTTLVNGKPALAGEYNGVNIQIANDGSCQLTFRGATDNVGKPLDSSQGNTVVSIATDGSFQVQHSTITFNLAKSGVVTVKSSGDMNIDCANANVTASGNATVTGGGTTTVEAPSVKLGKGAAEAVIKGKTFKGLFDAHIHPTPVGPSGPPSQPLSPSALSTKVTTE